MRAEVLVIVMFQNLGHANVGAFAQQLHHHRASAHQPKQPSRAVGGRNDLGGGSVRHFDDWAWAEFWSVMPKPERDTH